MNSAESGNSQVNAGSQPNSGEAVPEDADAKPPEQVASGFELLCSEEGSLNPDEMTYRCFVSNPKTGEAAELERLDAVLPDAAGDVQVRVERASAMALNTIDEWLVTFFGGDEARRQSVALRTSLQAETGGMDEPIVITAPLSAAVAKAVEVQEKQESGELPPVGGGESTATPSSASLTTPTPGSTAAPAATATPGTTPTPMPAPTPTATEMIMQTEMPIDAGESTL